MAARPRPQFVDPYANGQIYLLLDGNQLPTSIDLSKIQWNDDGTPVTGTAPNGGPDNLPDGGSISYSSTITATELDVTMSLTTVSGISHTFGIVQTNGACPSSDPCLDNPYPGFAGAGKNTGYVLAEGQTPAFTLSTVDANNSPITLTLRGVLESGFICATQDPSCSNGAGPLGSDGYYHLRAFPTDENGDSLISKTMPAAGWPANQTPYDNGKWEIAVTQGANLIDIQPENTQGILTPFSAPNPVQLPSGNWWDAEGFKFKCLQTGTATIAMRMVQDASQSAGQVSGFSYSSANYPAAGALLGSTGSDLYFGNGAGMTVSCTAYGTVSITAN